MTLFFSLIQIVAIPAISPLFVGIIRKLKARMQSRVGADIFQPYRDLSKLFKKDEIISKDASWITKIAPYIIFTVTVVVGAAVPIVTTIIPSFTPGFSLLPLSDFIVMVYLLALGTFFLALAGMDSGSGFGGFGSSREMMVAALAEGGLFFSLLVASVASGSGHVPSMVVSLQTLPFTSFMPLIVAFLAFFIALLAENNRFPVDNPSTHLELTMIHEAMILEYSGKRLALMEWATANKLVIFIALGANIFFPWGVAASLEGHAILLAFVLFSLKTGALLFSIAFIESTMAKFRVFRVPDLLFTSFVLAVTALCIIITF
jgi:formate hydrogenlyase subunit 4